LGSPTFISCLGHGFDEKTKLRLGLIKTLEPVTLYVGPNLQQWGGEWGSSMGCALVGLSAVVGQEKHLIAGECNNCRAEAQTTIPNWLSTPTQRHFLPLLLTSFLFLIAYHPRF